MEKPLSPLAARERAMGLGERISALRVALSSLTTFARMFLPQFERRTRSCTPHLLSKCVLLLANLSLSFMIITIYVSYPVQSFNI